MGIQNYINPKLLTETDHEGNQKIIDALNGLLAMGWLDGSYFIPPNIWIGDYKNCTTVSAMNSRMKVMPLS